VYKQREVKHAKVSLRDAKYCVCLLDVCLSAYLTQKLHGQTSQNFWEYCTWSWLDVPLVALWYILHFQFCGWRHVFT